MENALDENIMLTLMNDEENYKQLKGGYLHAVITVSSNMG